MLAMILSLYWLSVPAQAAPVDPADCADPSARLVLRTQAEIDSFPCTTVAGRLNIDSRGVGTPFDLTPLSKLTRVDGSLILTLTDSTPANLDGLENVTAVGGLTIVGDASLTDISALSNLAQIQCAPSPGCTTLLRLQLPGLAAIPAWGIAGSTTVDSLQLEDFPPPRSLPGGYINLPDPNTNFTARNVDFDPSVLADGTALANKLRLVNNRVNIENAPTLT